MSLDLVIVGAGPAGVSAALAAKPSKFTSTLIEAEAPGGQLHRIYGRVTGGAPVNEMAGEPFEGNGAGLASRLTHRLRSAGIDVALGAQATGLSRTEDALVLDLMGGERLVTRAILIATGLRARRLEVPGERTLEGRGVSTSASRDRDRFAGRPVVVVGGGDAAFENALLLAQVGCPVSLVVRSVPRARSEFRLRASARASIRILQGTRVLSILGQDHVTGVEVAGPDGTRTIETAAVFVKVGSVPNTEWCRDGVKLDSQGYVVAGADGATSMPGVWAAGDVMRPPELTVGWAATTASAAIASIRRHLSEV